MILRPTTREEEVFQFIHHYHVQHDYGPTAEEICVGFDLSKQRVYELLNGLEDKGRITWRRHHAGGIVPVESGVHEPAIIAPWPSTRPSLLERAKQSIYRAGDLNEFRWAVMVARLIESTKARSICLHQVIEEDETLLRPVVWQGRWRADQTPRSFKRGAGVCGRVWDDPESFPFFVSVGDIQDFPEFSPPQASREKLAVRSLCVVPVLEPGGQEVMATLSLESNRVDYFSNEVAVALQALVQYEVAEATELYRGVERAYLGFNNGR